MSRFRLDASPRRTATIALSLAMALGACGSDAPAGDDADGGVPAGEPTAIVLDYPGPSDDADVPTQAVAAGGYPSPPADGAEVTNDVGPETAALAAALATRDYSALGDLMVDPFTVGYWRSEGVSLNRAEAEDLLMTSLLPSEAVIDTITDRSLFPLLDGAPVDAMFGPDVVIHEVLFSRGWGVDGAGEALLYLSEVDGAVRWHGLIWAATGFDDAGAGG